MHIGREAAIAVTPSSPILLSIIKCKELITGRDVLLNEFFHTGQV